MPSSPHFLRLSAILAVVFAAAAASAAARPAHAVRPAAHGHAARSVRLQHASAADGDGDVDVREEHALSDEERQLSERLRKIAAHRQRIAHKKALLAHVRELKERAEKKDLEVDVMHREDNEAHLRRERAVDEGLRLQGHIYKLSKDALESEEETERIRSELLPELDHEMENIKKNLHSFTSQDESLKQQEMYLERKLNKLASSFRSNGLEKWLERNTHDLSPTLRQSVLLSVNALEPLAEGISDTVNAVVEMDEQYSNDFAHSTGVDDEFVVGSVFYVILLAPLVAFLWAIFRLRNLATRISLRTYLIAFSLYFTVLSVICGVSSLLIGDEDIIVSFYASHKRPASIFVGVNVTLFLIHFALQALHTIGRHQIVHIAQLLGLFCVGVHFYLNGVGRVLAHARPGISLQAYTFYSLAFAFILAHQCTSFTSPRWANPKQEKVSPRKQSSPKKDDEPTAVSMAFDLPSSDRVVVGGSLPRPV